MRELKVFLLAALIFSLLYACRIFPQDKNPDYNPLSEKKWSAVFEIGTFMNNWGGNMYKSFTLSGKYNLNKTNGVRLSLTTSGGTRRETNTAEYNFGNPLSNYNEGLGLESDLHWIHYLSADSKIKAYFGIGPYFNLDYSSKYTDDEQGYISYSDKSTGYSIGLSCVFGLEYFFLDNIGLVGEYYGSGYYNKTVETTFDRTTYSNNGRKMAFGWNYSITKMRLGFAVYF